MEKNEKDLNLKLPSIWENEKEKFWIESTRQISEILIEKYCLHIKYVVKYNMAHLTNAEMP